MKAMNFLKLKKIFNQFDFPNLNNEDIIRNNNKIYEGELFISFKVGLMKYDKNRKYVNTILTNY